MNIEAFLDAECFPYPKISQTYEIAYMYVGVCKRAT